MALYFNGNKIIGSDGTCSADKVSLDDTNLAYVADDVQEAFEKVTKSLTYDEYEALTDAEKNNGTIYLITDVNGDGQSFQPVIYSAEEREVGVWIDGKPLYQKTLTCTAATGIGPNDWTTIPWDSEPSDIEFLVTGQVHQGDVPNSYATVRAAYTGGHVKLAALYSGTFSANARFTIWYTKTTDAPGSGTWTPQGIPAVHYSTDEKVVGTWIDGSTVYEKVFDLGSEVSIPYTSWYDTSITGMAAVISCFGMNNSGAHYPLNTSIQNSKLHLWGCRGTEVSPTRYLTVRYTKSST